jgi:hypothetical protein
MHPFLIFNHVLKENSRTSCFQIDRCRPKIIVDLEELSQYIERLTIVRAVSHLSEVLLPGDADDSGAFETPLPDAAAKRWNKLKELRLPHNYIVNLDESLMLLSAVTVIDLSDNMIERIENLQFCYSLVTLDLSYNRIRSVHSSVHSLGNLRYLALRGNGLSSTLGLEKLLGLERLDLRDNSISSLEDIARLARLPFLEFLFLLGNPITQKKNYRREVYLHLHKESLVLDGQSASRSEKEAARSANFQPQDGGEGVSTHGVFTPPYPQAMALFGPPPASKSIYTGASNGSMRYITGGASSVARSPSNLTSLYEPSTSYPGDGGMSAMASAAALSKRRAKAAVARKRLAQIDSTNPDNIDEDGNSPPVDIGRPIGEGSSPDGAVIASPGGTMSPLKETIDKLHEGHGASWLLVYNEFKKSKAPTTTATSSSSHSTKKKRDKTSSSSMSPPKDETDSKKVPASAQPAEKPIVVPAAAKKQNKPRTQGPFVLSMPITTADDDGTGSAASNTTTPREIPTVPSPAESPRGGSQSSSMSSQSSPPLEAGILSEPVEPATPPTPQDTATPSSLPDHPSSAEPESPRKPEPPAQISSTPPPVTEQPKEVGVDSVPAPTDVKPDSPQAEPAPAAPIVPQPEKPINISKVSSSPTEESKEQFEKTEEFYAEVQNDKGDWEPRILILTPKFIEEGDTTTGSSVVRHDLKHIVDARNLTDEVPGSQGETEWLIRLDFRTSGSTSSHHTVCFYKLESSTDAKRLTSSLRATIDKSTRKIKCMTCNSEFKLQEIDACPRCKSAMLIFFDGALPASQPVSAPMSTMSTIASMFSAASPPKNQPVSALSVSPKNTAAVVTPMRPSWDESEPTLDGNKQLYLRLTFFKKDDNSENLMSYFPCSYVPFGYSLSREAPGSIMLSNLNIYILQPKSRRRTMILSAFMSAQGYDDEDELVAAIPFSDVKRVVIGPFYQWFRIEVSPQQIFVFVTRAHERTHKFLGILKQTMRDKIGYVEVSNRNQEIVQSIAQDCHPGGGPMPQLELFFWLFQRVKPGAGRLMQSISRSEVSVLPRTLIVTAEELLLVDEDMRLPFPTFTGVVRPKVPQFVVAHRRKISELSSIEVDPAQPNFVKLCFDEDSVGSSSSKVNDGGSWGLFCQKSVESNKLKHVLAREWRALFHVPLTVVEMDGIAAISS